MRTHGADVGGRTGTLQRGLCRSGTLPWYAGGERFHNPRRTFRSGRPERVPLPFQRRQQLVVRLVELLNRFVQELVGDRGERNPVLFQLGQCGARSFDVVFAIATFQ